MKSGLRQGDALSPVLFNLALEKVIRDMEVPCEAGSLLAFADDVVFMGPSKEVVAALTKAFLVSARRLGLVVNQSKTKYLVMSKINNPVLSLRLDFRMVLHVFLERSATSNIWEPTSTVATSLPRRSASAWQAQTGVILVC